jgi:hypothetical protein
VKIKRTYNLSPSVVDTVKALVEERHAARTQDALVEAAVQLFARQLRDRDDAARWAEAANDASFQDELNRLWAECDSEDRAAWED